MEINILLSIASGVLTLLVFPFVSYQFKRNEELHARTQEKVSTQGTMLAVHEVKILQLEQWRNGFTNPPPQQNVTVNPVTHD